MTRPTLHTVAEAVPILRKSKSWIYAAMRDRRIPFTEIGDNKYLSDDNIAEILQRGARPAHRTPGERHERPKTKTKAPQPKTTPPARTRPRHAIPAGDIPRADPTASRKYRTGSPA